MKKTIFISAPYLQSEWGKYKNQFDEFNVILPDVLERMGEIDLIEMFNKDMNIIGGIVGDDKFTKKVYDNAPNLKLLVKWGTGIDSLNKNIANTFGVEIYRTPSAFTIPVSESTIGLMLSFCRTIHQSNIEVHKSNWTKVSGITLNESKVGIIGLGNIGTEVAKKLEIFGSSVSFYDPNVNNFKYKKYLSLTDMLINCDIITIHCDLNETSKYLIGYKELELLKGKLLINTARGEIINQKDLENYIIDNENCPLNQIKLGLDVFEYEPLNSDIIQNNDNHLLSAHNTNTSPKFWENVHLNSINMFKNNI